MNKNFINLNSSTYKQSIYQSTVNSIKNAAGAIVDMFAWDIKGNNAYRLFLKKSFISFAHSFSITPPVIIVLG